MFELGTDRMWAKVSRPQLRDDSLDERDRANGPQHRHMENANSDFQSKGRMIDDYYFDKSKRRDSRGEYKAMCPRSPSEEDRMMRIALEASKREREIEAEEEFRLDNIGSRQRQQNGKTSVPPSKLYSIGEDNLIDFGVDDAAKAVSQINISRQSTDVSVLGDDDATTASFVLDTAWNGNSATGPSPAQQQSGLSPRHLYPNQYQQRPPPQLQQQQQIPHYHDPTFNHAHYTQPQRPWSSAGTVSSNPTTPRGGGLPPSDASFAVPPPPTLADYKQAFGSTMSMAAGSVHVNSMMSPMSNGSVGMMSPMAAQMQQLQQKVSVGGSMASNKFDPLRSDPFA